MSRPMIVALVLVLAAVAGCDEDEERTPAACRDHCGKQAAAGCAQPFDEAACLDACAFLWNGGPCRSELRAFFTCTAGATWACDAATGYPSFADQCLAEGEAFSACSDALP